MYEPKIVGFLCTWCSYTGADTAGIARLKYPANLRAVRVPCSGRVSPELILHAFDQGADGVLVLGCHIGECHYETGNHRAAKRIPGLHALLTFAGLERERLRLDWVSASEGERFARIVSQFTEAVRELGPARWKVTSDQRSVLRSHYLVSTQEPLLSQDQLHLEAVSLFTDYYTGAIRDQARQLLGSGQVSCVIGYEQSPRGRTRPAFVYSPDEVERLVWNQDCTHNLTVYLPPRLHARPGEQPSQPAAVVVKPCDSRTINVHLAEHQYNREQVHAIGVVCPGILATDNVQRSQITQTPEGLRLQSRCQGCKERLPRVYDTLIGDEAALELIPSPGLDPLGEAVAGLSALSSSERMEYWLSQFDRCLRCYACRQACPLCNCPTCLYERDDSLWVGLGIGLDEKRTFHLGRAYHLAGRCVGCNECERVCPVGIPIGLLNQHMAQEMQAVFGHRAGQAPVPSPFVTILAGEEG